MSDDKEIDMEVGEDIDFKSIPEDTEVHFFGMDLGTDDRTVFFTARKTSDGDIEIIDTIQPLGSENDG